MIYLTLPSGEPAVFRGVFGQVSTKPMPQCPRCGVLYAQDKYPEQCRTCGSEICARGERLMLV